MTYGNRIDIDDSGLLRIDGANFRGGVPTLGKDIFVDSVTGQDTGSDGLTPDRALATLDAAINKCTADKGDQIFILPNHAETWTASGDAALDIDGVSIFGLGYGANRPVFTITTANNAGLTIAGDDAFVTNIVIVAGVAGLVQPILPQGKDCWLDNIEFQESGGFGYDAVAKVGNAASDNLCDGFKMTNCRLHGAVAAGTGWLNIRGDIDRVVVRDNIFISATTGACAIAEMTAGDDMQHALIVGNTTVIKDTATAVTVLSTDQTDNTGIIADNYAGCLDVAGEVISTANSGMYHFQNRSSSVVTASGYLLPAADTA